MCYSCCEAGARDADALVFAGFGMAGLHGSEREEAGRAPEWPRQQPPARCSNPQEQQRAGFRFSPAAATSKGVRPKLGQVGATSAKLGQVPAAHSARKKGPVLMRTGPYHSGTKKPRPPEAGAAKARC